MAVPVHCALGQPGLQPITIREQRVTDDLDRLLAVLPESLQQQLASGERRQDLLEVVLDLGRFPEARYPGRRLDLEDAPLSREALDGVIDRVLADELDTAGEMRRLETTFPGYHYISCLI